MSYQEPGVQVSQTIATQGGVLDATPDLNACVVGPLFNVVRTSADTSVVLEAADATLSVLGIPIPGPYASTAAGVVLAEYVPPTSPGTPHALNPGIKSLKMPTHKLGQHLVEGSPSLVAKNAAVRIGWVVVESIKDSEFTATSRNILRVKNTGDTLVTDSAYNLSNGQDPEKPSGVPAVGMRKLPDGSLPLQAGDLVKFTLTTATGTILRQTYVRSVSQTWDTNQRYWDIELAEKVTDANGLADSGSAMNDNVVIDLYRVYSSVTLPLVFAGTLGTTLNYCDQSHANQDYVLYFSDRLQVPLSFTPVVDTFVVNSAQSLHLGYKALRTDLSESILTLADDTERVSLLGEATPDNPLAFGVHLAFFGANGRPVKALSLGENTDSGYLEAVSILEGVENVYYLCPLTSKLSLITMFRNHCLNMSTPQEGAWRVSLVNVTQPGRKRVVSEPGLSSSPVELRTKAYLRQIKTGSDVDTWLIDPDVDFLTSNVQAADTVTIETFDDGIAGNSADGTLPNGTEDVDFIGTWLVSQIVDSHTLLLESTNPAYAATSTAGDGSAYPQSNSQIAPYYIDRTITKTEVAEYIAEVSTGFNSKRVWHIQPDSISADVEGTTQAGLPGYYLACVVAGTCAGEAVQQNMTNFPVSGVIDLQHSNYYFRRSQLRIMAGAGTSFYIQSVEGGVPFSLHALTTELTALATREQMKVKNLDFLSYYFKNLIKPYVGTWNITEDLLVSVRGSIEAGASLLMDKKLPRIGAPLVGYKIVYLEQNPVNKDRVRAKIRVALVDPANYFDIDLEV